MDTVKIEIVPAENGYAVSHTEKSQYAGTKEELYVYPTFVELAIGLADMLLPYDDAIQMEEFLKGITFHEVSKP